MHIEAARPAIAGAAPRPIAAQPADGVIRLRSSHDFDETVRQLKADVAAKGIRFFDEVDQARLGVEAGIMVPRSTLILVGMPLLMPYAWIAFATMCVVIAAALITERRLVSSYAAAPKQITASPPAGPGPMPALGQSMGRQGHAVAG